MGQRRRTLSGLPFPWAKYAVEHWAADDLMYLADAAKVTTHVGRIRGAVAVQATGANQPSFKRNAYQGLPAVYNVNSHWLRVTDPKDLLTILNPPSIAHLASGYTVIVVRMGDGTASTNANPAVVGNAATSNSNLWIGAGAGLSGRSFNGSSAVPSANNAFEVIAIAQPAFATNNGTSTDMLNAVYVNGTRVGRSAVSVLNFGASDIVLGSGGPGSTWGTRGYTFDVIIVRKELTQPEIAEVTKWAFDRFRLPYPWAGLPYFVLGHGDSVPAGTGPSLISETYVYKVAAGGAGYSLGLTNGQWGNIAGSGYKLAAFDHVASKHLDGLSGALGGIPVLMMLYGYRNDGGGAAYVPLQNAMITKWKAKNPGLKVIVATAYAYTASPADRNAFNAAYDADAKTQLDGYVRMHNDTLMGPDGSYTTNPTYYNADLTHPSALGETEIATYTGPVAQAIIGGAVGLQVSSI